MHTRWQTLRSRCPDWLWDTGLALLALALLVVEVRSIEDYGGYLGPDAVAVLLYALLLGALLLRRRFPVAMALLVLATSYTYQALGYVTLATIELVTLVALFSAAAQGRRMPRTLALGIVALWLLAVNQVAPVGLEPSGLVIMYVILAGAWMLGERDRTHRAYAAMLAERNALLLRQRELEAQHAAATERTRIARELHDVIAHGLGVVVVQAEAALYDPAVAASEAHGPLDAIRTTARASLTEARRVLGIRRDDPTSARGPQPSVADLPRLAAEFTTAGLEVTLTVRGDTALLGPGLDLSIYRIVEEALTNTLRHAGAEHARVTLEVTPTAAHLAVIDDGPPTSSPAHASAPPPAHPEPVEGRAPGHGLIGMRERVTMLHGALEVGPQPAGGYAVRASFPLEPTAGIEPDPGPRTEAQRIEVSA
jgi:signal transduction histidine kinase